VVSALAQDAPRPARSASSDVPDTNPYSSAADLEIGRRLYNGRCGHCHGLNGEGGRGAVLNAGRFRRGGTDRELFQIVRTGIPDTEMPGAAILPSPDIWRLVAYVKQLSKQGTSEPSRGDVTAGAIVYERNGCATCHSIDRKGGFLGPDLTGIGSRRAVRH